jgi:hypothetical protein
MANDQTTTTTAPPLPQAQGAGHAPRNPDVQTRPPQVQPPLTSTTGTGFNAPDAGTEVPNTGASGSVGSAAGAQAAGAAPTLLPKVGNVDRDAAVGEAAGPGSQATSEEISSTGPVSQ